MRCFVAGGTGVLGRRVVPLLAASDHDVAVLSRDPHRDGRILAMGATPLRADLFAPATLSAALAGRDAIVNLATHIPPLRRAAWPGAWQENDRIRTEGVTNLLTAARERDVGRFVQESITFTYADAEDRWIDEDAPRTTTGLGAPVAHAEAATRAYTEAGGAGVILRFAQLYASDSSHTRSQARMSRFGVNPFPGSPDSVLAFVGADAAARAVVAALTLAPGVYNVADADPPTRRRVASDVARTVGRPRLRRLPTGLLRRMNPDADVLMRSQRVSNRRLMDAAGWRPDHGGADGLTRTFGEILR